MVDRQGSDPVDSVVDPGYPEQWQTHAVLADGSPIELRPIRASDREALSSFHQRQSRESIYFRFFRHRPDLSESELDFFTQVDYSDRMAFVAMLGPTLVAVARYEKSSGKDEAEVAFFVDDDHHGRGLATLMLEYLAAAARNQGIQRFTASVLSENYRMLGVFRKAGFEVKSRFSDGYIAVDMDIAVTEKATSVIADRARRSRARSVVSVVSPQGIVVVGASRHPGAIGYELLASLTGRSAGKGFRGPVVAVNRAVSEVAGQPTFATVAEAVAAAGANADADEIGVAREEYVGRHPYDGTHSDGEEASTEFSRTIDLAVIAVPAAEIGVVIDQCAAAGIKSVFIVSSGFSEVGAAGESRQRELVDLVRRAGLRLVGPNAFGMVNTAPAVQMNALYINEEVAPGPVGLVSQSGPLGVALLRQLRALGVGISTFVGVGNRADVSVNDLLDYWSSDEETTIVMMYVENYGNLRNFAAAASRLTQTKSLLAISPAAPERRDLLANAGVTLVESVSQLASQAKVASSQPTAKGDRVAIISNTSSLGRLAHEACLANGLSVIVPSEAKGGAGQDTILIGDVDTVALLPSSEPDDYEKVIVETAVSAEVDLVLIAIAPTPFLEGGALNGLLDRVNRSIDKPMVAVGLTGSESVSQSHLPYFTYPEQAAKALAVHARHGLWRSRVLSSDAETSADRAIAIADPEQLVAIVESLTPATGASEVGNKASSSSSAESSLTLADEQMAQILRQLDLPIADYEIGSDLKALLGGASRIGYPVVLKANMRNRTVGEGGGAAIDLHDDSSLGAAHARMVEAFGQSMSAAVVQRMVSSSELARIELVQEPELGSQVSIGWGRTGAQRRSSTGRRYLPLRPGEAAELVTQFFNHHNDVGNEIGAASSEPNSLSDIDRANIRVLSAIVRQLEAIAELTPLVARLSLDPILLNGLETEIADVEIVVRRWTTSPLSEVRHL